ncbi:MAG: GNAT family N-acetyltransferase [Devosia sp.]
MIRIAVDPFPDQAIIDGLWLGAWGGPAPGYAQNVLPRSLVHVGAFVGERMIGFVNVAWDGGQHAFLLDTCVDPAMRRKGIATTLVQRAVHEARARGAEWLHVDFEPDLEAFYRTCGFGSTAAGLIRLK